MDSMRNFKDEDDGSGSKLSSYLEQLCGQIEFINSVELDHNYSKPWNWRPDNTYAKPMKSLFVMKTPCHSISNEEILDPVYDHAKPKPAYEEEKARKLMDESSRQIHLLRSDVGDLNWELSVKRNDWTLQQNRIFDRGCRILHNDHLARLSYQGHWNEPLLRKVSVDRSARRLRTLFSTFGWQYQLVRWLHYLWLDLLHHEYLVAYVEMLQTLKRKVPSLIERLTMGVPQTTKANADVLYMMLQSHWDPSSIALPCHQPRRLPGNPLLLIVPSGSDNTNSPNTRTHRWHSHLSAIGTVMLVNTNKLNTSKVTVTNSLEHLMASTRAKVAELKSDYIGRNIILIGLNSGAALACQVSLVEPVSAVICLGFPMNTVEEKRGQPDDSILNLNVPTLFVIGKHAATVHVNDLEDLRERLRVQTSLVVVGGADDCLRITHSKRSADGMTQNMVDRCIVDEVADFVGTVLLTPNNKQDNRSTNSKPRMKLVEKKRKISINDDVLPKKHRISLSSAQSGITLNMNPLGRTKKAATPRSGARNIKWTNETDGRIQTIQRRHQLDDKALISRSTIDSIRIINKNVSSFKPTTLTGEGDDGETYSILSEIKVINSDDCSSESNFVGQLTADRLLEMPVIIAQEDGTGTGGSTITGTPSHQHMQPMKVMVTSGSGIMREDSNQDTNEVLRQTAGIRCVSTSSTSTSRTSTIHIGRSHHAAVANKSLQPSITSSTKSEDSIRNTLTKCATIYFRDQQANTSSGISSQAKLHKVDFISRGSNNGQTATQTTIRRRNFSTQLISRPRPPRIRNFPAVKHCRNDLTSPVPE
ncbi:reduction in Cnn dots 1 isoform X3 [Rhodnius prolixus]